MDKLVRLGGGINDLCSFYPSLGFPFLFLNMLIYSPRSAVRYEASKFLLRRDKPENDIERAEGSETCVVV